MTTPSLWDTFPLTYRTAEIRQLAQWIAAGQSGSVVGLPGCGRSILLDFVCHQPAALQTYLPANAPALVPVDLNDLPAYDLATFYRVILRSFYRARGNFSPDLQQIVSTLYLEYRASTDPFLAQTALQEILLACQSKPVKVILVLNRFDRFCQQASLPMLNTLRSLRDGFRETLCFIAGMRQEVAYLPNPEALGDMYELLDSQVCWVGALNEHDARQQLARITRTASIPPTEVEIETMLALSGGFSVLLRAISDWWLTSPHKPSPATWRTALAQERSFEYRLARMWHGLTQEEQFALAAVGEGQRQSAASPTQPPTTPITTVPALPPALRHLPQDPSRILFRLAAKGVCHQVNGEWQILGNLLADYVQRVGPSSRGRIRLDERTEELYQGLTPLRGLAPQESKMLRFLVKQPYKRHTLAQLIAEIWGDDETRGSEHVQRLVSDLRKKIEVHPAEPRYLLNWRLYRESGYQFFPEGRPE